jgi:hypothetical protein
MTILKQNGPVCGQTCVAMLLDLELIDVIAEIGSRPMWQKDMRAALQKHGYEIGQRRKYRGVVPPYSLLWVKGTTPSWSSPPNKPYFHWMISWEGRVINPAGEWPSAFYDGNAYIVSWFPLLGKQGSLLNAA